MRGENTVNVGNGWIVQYNPKPIPIRDFDYDFWHDDHDIGGEIKLCGCAKSIDDAIEQINEIEVDISNLK